MDMLISIVSFVLVLGVIVAVHELGHLIAAKMFNVYCAEFAIGMGPKLYSWQGKETKYSLRLLPIGGYVAMAGETEQDTDLFPNDLPSERTVTGVNPWKRIIIQIAGVVMNLLLGIVIFAFVFNLWGSPYESSREIAQVLDGSPAKQAGLQPGDVITAMHIDGETVVVESYEDMDLASDDVAKERGYTVVRDGEEMTFTMTPAFDTDSESYLVGIAFGAKSVGFFESLKIGVLYTWEAMTLIVSVVRGLFVGIGFENLSGPVGIYTATSQFASEGIIPLVFFTGIMSVNIGVVQLLPLPALDGGRVVFSLWEAITGKPVNQKLEMVLILGSFALLFLLIIMITFKDIINLF